MSLIVACPTCGAKLQVSDAIAGTSVRCPKCKTPLHLPAAKSPPDDKRPTASAPSPRRVENDPDQDEKRDRPRKKPRKKQQGRGAAFWVLLAVGMIVLAGLGIGGSLVAYHLLRAKDSSSSASGDPASQAASGEGSRETAVGGTKVKYVPRESEKKLSEFLKGREGSTVTDEQVFAIMGEPTRRSTPITARKGGQVFTVYEAFWEVPGSGVLTRIGFSNGRMAGAIIGLETTQGSDNKK